VQQPSLVELTARWPAEPKLVRKPPKSAFALDDPERFGATAFALRS
jgi:hypothetical protein